MFGRNDMRGGQVDKLITLFKYTAEKVVKRELTSNDQLPNLLIVLFYGIKEVCRVLDGPGRTINYSSELWVAEVQQKLMAAVMPAREDGAVILKDEMDLLRLAVLFLVRWGLTIESFAVKDPRCCVLGGVFVVSNVPGRYAAICRKFVARKFQTLVESQLYIDDTVGNIKKLLTEIVKVNDGPLSGRTIGGKVVGIFGSKYDSAIGDFGNNLRGWVASADRNIYGKYLIEFIPLFLNNIATQLANAELELMRLESVKDASVKFLDKLARMPTEITLHLNSVSDDKIAENSNGLAFPCFLKRLAGNENSVEDESEGEVILADAKEVIEVQVVAEAEGFVAAYENVLKKNFFADVWNEHGLDQFFPDLARRQFAEGQLSPNCYLEVLQKIVSATKSLVVAGMEQALTHEPASIQIKGGADLVEILRMALKKVIALSVENVNTADYCRVAAIFSAFAQARCFRLVAEFATWALSNLALKEFLISENVPLSVAFYAALQANDVTLLKSLLRISEWHPVGKIGENHTYENLLAILIEHGTKEMLDILVEFFSFQLQSALHEALIDDPRDPVTRKQIPIYYLLARRALKESTEEGRALVIKLAELCNGIEGAQDCKGHKGGMRYRGYDVLNRRDVSGDMDYIESIKRLIKPATFIEKARSSGFMSLASGTVDDSSAARNTPDPERFSIERVTPGRSGSRLFDSPASGSRAPLSLLPNESSFVPGYVPSYLQNDDDGESYGW